MRTLLTFCTALLMTGCATVSPDTPLATEGDESDANAAIAAAVPSTDIVLVSLPSILARRDPGRVVTVTARRGYDNQPAFDDDGRYVYFSRIVDGEQSDVYRFELASRKTEQMTHTAQSEYTPTPLVNGAFSCIQVALDGTQRLWVYRRDGAPMRALREDITDVGYHTWLSSQQLALFIVAEQMRLEVATLGDTQRKTLASNIGRSLQRTPAGSLSFVQADMFQENRQLMEWNPANDEFRPRAMLPGAGRDVVWLADGSALVADGRTLYRLAPGADRFENWVNLARSVAGDISRMAVDPSGDWLALVVSESE